MTSRSLIALSIGAVCAGLLTAVTFFEFTVDDAYIVLRYARNVWSHGELGFNAGERVSTLTSPLHGILATLLYGAAGDYALQINKALMIALVGVSSWLLIRSGRHDGRVWVLVLVIVFASPFVWMWAVGGLETILVACVISALATLYASADRTRAFLAINALAGIAFLARYDTAFFVLPVLAGVWWQTWRRRDVTTLVIGVCMSAALPLTWLAFSAYYFHDIFPTSFYAKASRTITLHTITYMGQFLLLTGVLPLWLLAVLRASRVEQEGLRQFCRQRLPLVAGLTLIFAYGSAHATAHMMFGYRLLLPYLPVLLLLGLDLLRLGDSDETGLTGDRTVALLAGAVLALQIGQAVTIHSRSLSGIGLTGEFRRMSLSAYTREYLPVMEAGCRDLAAHAQGVPRFSSRTPRFLTFAEGYIPYCDKSLHVLGHLVSYRHGINEGFPPEVAFGRSADYIYVLTPRHGTVPEQLPQPIEYFDEVSSHTIMYDGREETFAIYFNLSPHDTRLPPYTR
jgi:hypothetical protein